MSEASYDGGRRKRDLNQPRPPMWAAKYKDRVPRGLGWLKEASALYRQQHPDVKVRPPSPRSACYRKSPADCDAMWDQGCRFTKQRGPYGNKGHCAMTNKNPEKGFAALQRYWESPHEINGRTYAARKLSPIGQGKSKRRSRPASPVAGRFRVPSPARSDTTSSEASAPMSGGWGRSRSRRQRSQSPSSRRRY